MSSGVNSSCIRTALLIGAGVATTTGISYMVYRYLGGRRVADTDEGFVDETKTEAQNERKVLVLGLDNSGKSTLLANLSKNDPNGLTQPTQGFKVICYQTGKVKLSFWEIGGVKSMRQYWNNFVQDTSVFVFVVDSSDEPRFSEAFSALHEISGDERLKKVPIVLVANKQDVNGAKTSQEVMHALGLDNLSRLEHPVHVLPTSVDTNGSPHGVDELEKLLKRLCS